MILQAVYTETKAFRNHQEIRFAGYQVRLTDAAVNNLPAYKVVWSQLEITGNRKERAEAHGFSRKK